jgi:hypothetical protein
MIDCLINEKTTPKSALAWFLIYPDSQSYRELRILPVCEAGELANQALKRW